MSDLLSLDATAQLQALAARQVSAGELLAAAVARTDRLNPTINAVVARDIERATREARLIDERRARNETVGALAGLPITVKDTLDVEGLPGSAGLPEFLNRSCKDAEVVARVRGASAVVWGKTNSPVKAADWQTYNALYGTTNNPWDRSRTPGGSSGGSAAALAAEMTALEIGADIGGSLRIPASFCGVFAHKPTYGLVSQRGLVPPADGEIDLAVVGPMARSARDLRLLLSIIAGAPIAATAPSANMRGLKVALWMEAPGFVLDAPVREMVTGFARRLGEAGAEVTRIAPPVDAEELMETYITLLCTFLGSDLPPLTRALYEIGRPAAKLARMLGADAMSAAHALLGHTARRSEWVAADAARGRFGATMAEFFRSHDVMLAPVSPVPAFAHDHSTFLSRKLMLSDGRRIRYREMMRWIALATVCGLPATSVPAGLTPNGLPIGVQLIGPHGGDARVLAIAQGIEEQLGGFTSPPEV